MLTLTGIGKTYPNGLAALDAIDLTIAEASFTSIVGPSGCGKSTLLWTNRPAAPSPAGLAKSDWCSRMLR